MRSDRIITTAAMAVVLAMGCQPAAGAQRSVQLGRQVAEDVCSACHVVSDDQVEPPILNPPAPSFPLIASRKGLTERSIRAFVLDHRRKVRTGDMPDPMITDAQGIDVSRYLMSLRKKAPN